MIGKSSLMLLGMAAVAGAVLFETSFKVQELDENLSAINRQIVAEHDAIQVLHAEWALLNEPSRLDHLAKTFLPLQPAETRQYAAISIIPDRKATPVADTVLPAVAALPGMQLPRAKPASVATRPVTPPPVRKDENTMIARADKPVSRPTAPREDSMGVLIARLGATR